MNFVSNEDLRKIINEAVNSVLKEAGAMSPLKASGAPTPLKGAGAPTPLRGTGAPTPLKGTGAPTPLKGTGAPTPLKGASAPTPLKGAGAPTPLAASPNGSSSQQAPPLLAATGSDNFTFEGKQTKNGFRPGVNDCKYGNFFETVDPSMQDETVLKIDLDYIHNLTVQKWINLLNTQFGNILYAKKQDKPWLAKKIKTKEEKAENDNFQYFVRLIILPGKNNDFINAADQIIDSLYQMRQTVNRVTKFTVKYDPTFEGELIQRIRDMVKKTPTQEEIEEVNIKIADSWVELLSKMQDPAVRQKLGNINGYIASAPAVSKKQIERGDVSDDNGFAAGHQITSRNAYQVYLQDPNATFVTQEFQWRKWNHEVIDPNKFILITIPSKKKVTSDDKDTGAKMAGFAGGNDEFKERNKRGELGGGNKHAVKMNSQFASKDRVFFYTVKVYDVSNTAVMPGKTSLFFDGPDQDINLKDNLLGIPNAAARKNGYVPNTIATAAQSLSDDGESNPHVPIIRDALFRVASDHGAAIPNRTGNAEEDIVNCAYAYAEHLLETKFKGMSVQETQKAFCEGFTGGLAICVGIKSDTARSNLERALAANGKDSKIKQLIIQWSDELSALLEEVIAETQKIISGRKKLAAKKVPSTPNQTPTQQPSTSTPDGTYSKVVEESVGASNELGIHIMSRDEFASLFGVSLDDEGLYEEENDFVSNEMIKEAFFNFLDRMDNYDRF